MPRYNVRIEFRTLAPLTQEQGLEFWRIGQRFLVHHARRRSGIAELQTIVKASRPSEALALVESSVEDIVAQEPVKGFDRPNEAKFISFDANLIVETEEKVSA